MEDTEVQTPEQLADQALIDLSALVHQVREQIKHITPVAEPESMDDLLEGYTAEQISMRHDNLVALKKEMVKANRNLVLDRALALRSKGLSCIPEVFAHPAKPPASAEPWGKFVYNLPTEAELMRMFGKPLPIKNTQYIHNIKIICAFMFMVIEADTEKGVAWIQALYDRLLEEHPEWEGVIVQSARGRHFYFRKPDNAEWFISKLDIRPYIKEGDEETIVEVKGSGSTITAEGSRHFTGIEYTRVLGPADWKVDRLPEFPYDAIREFIPIKLDIGATSLAWPSEPAMQADIITRARHYLSKFPPMEKNSGRDNIAVKLAFVLVKGFGMPEELALELLLEWDTANIAPLGDKVIKGKIKGALKAKCDKPGFMSGSQAPANVLQLLERRTGKDGEESIIASWYNCLLILQHDPLFKDRIIADASSGKVYWLDQNGIWTDLANALDVKNEFHMLLKKRYGVAFAAEHVFASFMYAVRNNLQDGMRLTAESWGEWDGVSRMEDLFIRGGGAEDTALIRAYTRRFLVQLMARVYKPGCKADAVLMLVGKQGVKKSSLIQVLLGQNVLMPVFRNKLNDVVENDLFTEDVDPSSDESVYNLMGKLVAEWAELSSFRKSDNETLKKFITQRKWHTRMKFDIAATVINRRTCFIGTTNEDQFLSDPSGHRRYWCIRIPGLPHLSWKFDLEWLQANRLQILAEAREAYLAGDQWWLSDAEELLREQDNKQYEIADPCDVRIDEFLRLAGDKLFSSADLARFALELNRTATTGEMMRVTALLKRTDRYRQRAIKLPGAKITLSYWGENEIMDAYEAGDRSIEVYRHDFAPQTGDTSTYVRPTASSPDKASALKTGIQEILFSTKLN